MLSPRGFVTPRAAGGEAPPMLLSAELQNDELSRKPRGRQSRKANKIRDPPSQTAILSARLDATHDCSNQMPPADLAHDKGLGSSLQQGLATCSPDGSALQRAAPRAQEIAPRTQDAKEGVPSSTLATSVPLPRSPPASARDAQLLHHAELNDHEMAQRPRNAKDRGPPADLVTPLATPHLLRASAPDAPLPPEPRSPRPLPPGSSSSPGVLSARRRAGTPPRSRAVATVERQEDVVALRLGPRYPLAREVNRELHMSVVKDMLGEELRGLIREELQAVLQSERAIAGAEQGSGKRRVGIVDPWEVDAVEMSDRPQVHPSEWTDLDRVPDLLDIAPSSRDPEVPCYQKDRSTGVRPSRPADIHPDPDHDHGRQRNNEGPSSARASVDQRATYIERISSASHTCHSSGTLQARTQAEELASHFPSVENAILHLESAWSKLGVERAPDRTDCVSRFADSNLFTVLTVIMILLNCMFMTYEADVKVRNFTEPHDELVVIAEASFVGFFTLEFLVRVVRCRLVYFYGVHFESNWLDFIVLLTSVPSLFGSFSENVTWMRLFRIIRMLKALRVIRIMLMFRTLRAMIVSLASTVTDLIWCSVMLVMVLYVFALLFVMRVGSFLRANWEAIEADTIAELQESFGSVDVAMLHLFMSSHGGNDWSMYYHALQPTGHFNQGMFLCFVGFTNIALLNIILGIFVEHAMKHLKSTKEEQARDHAARELQLEADLTELANEADENKDGALSALEWRTAVRKGKMSSYLDMMGFRSHDLDQFIEMLSHHNLGRDISIQAFVRGCMLLKGSASCFHTESILIEVLGLQRTVRQQGVQLQRLLDGTSHH